MRNSQERIQFRLMKTSTFCIVPLPTDIAEKARRAAELRAKDHAVITVDSATGYPCRHCLRWAQPGERVILFPMLRFRPVIRIPRPDRFLSMLSAANVTAQPENIRPIFAMAVRSALTMRITT